MRRPKTTPGRKRVPAFGAVVLTTPQRQSIMPRTITAYRVQVPSEFVSVVARCTSEQEARRVARSRSGESDHLHYVVGPNDGFREYTASFHNGTER